MSSRPDCIFEINQLWQSGFSRVYSNCWCSCSFEPEIIKIGQSSHKMYSNKILNFQESTTILNACTKNLELYWRHLVYIYIYIYIYIYVTRVKERTVVIVTCCAPCFRGERIYCGISVKTKISMFILNLRLLYIFMPIVSLLKISSCIYISKVTRRLPFQ